MPKNIEVRWLSWHELSLASRQAWHRGFSDKINFDPIWSDYDRSERRLQYHYENGRLCAALFLALGETPPAWPAHRIGKRPPRIEAVWAVYGGQRLNTPGMPVSRSTSLEDLGL